MTPGRESELAADFVKEIRALAKKYENYEHLVTFTGDLENVAEEVEACIEDTEDVE